MADIFAAAERLMGMNDQSWARHANPLSVWTRILTPLPLLILAVWSRVWIGQGAWVAVALVCLWVWLNPRLFPAPRSLDSWAAKGVLGERLFLRRRASLPPHHLRATRLLTAVSALGVLPLLWGLWQLDLGWAVAGALLISGAKTWFVDRMVWIWDDHLRAGGGIEDVLSDPAKPR
jgi:hypothetical protein